MTMPGLRITQGATRSIVVDDIVDDNGDPLVVTGWTVLAQARPNPGSTTLYAEWASAPTGVQGPASAAGRTVRVDIPHAMSSAWAWSTAVLHVEITDPDTGRRERILDTWLVVDPEATR